LLVGHAQDAVCQMVGAALEECGYLVTVTSAPLAAPFSLRWRITNERMKDTKGWSGVDFDFEDIAGVLLRPSAGVGTPDGWNAKDLAYMQIETQAALLAWVCDLRCPVINQPSADVWFRPQRTYFEWHSHFVRCDLPALEHLCVTNDIGEARAYAQYFDGRATYAPLTSLSRYAVTEPHHWEELAKVMVHVPVCLLPPANGRSTYATVIGEDVVWNQNITFDASPMEPGLVMLAKTLRLDFIQIEVSTGLGGVYCVTADPNPLLERHDAGAQSAIIAKLVERLQSDHPASQKLPREVIALINRREFAA